MEELKPELDKLKACLADTKFSTTEEARKMYGMLKSIYKTFPPKIKGKQPAKLLEVKFDGGYTDAKKAELKKAYLKAVTHYHPDRQMEEHGIKWKVLAEEICKELTRRYEIMKGVE